WYIQTGYEPLARRFLVIADEAGSMGTCEALAKGITYLRAANCQILASFQSPGQVETLYRDPRSFQANFEAWIVPRAKDVELGRQLSDLMGDTTITSESHQSGGRDGKTSSQAARRLLAPGELRQLAWEEQIVLTDSLNIKCRKAFWFEDRNLRKEN
ncbi:MAG: type IV secretory system conjugative DNA transfer family protein, partial [Magnetovibrionaceae bacterium]